MILMDFTETRPPLVPVRAWRVHGRIDLAGRGIDEDRADVGFTVDLGEITDCQQLTAGQLDEVLHLVVKIAVWPVQSPVVASRLPGHGWWSPSRSCPSARR